MNNQKRILFFKIIIFYNLSLQVFTMNENENEILGMLARLTLLTQEHPPPSSKPPSIQKKRKEKNAQFKKLICLLKRAFPRSRSSVEKNLSPLFLNL